LFHNPNFPGGVDHAFDQTGISGAYATEMKKEHDSQTAEHETYGKDN